MASARAQGASAYQELNRAFGTLLEEAQHSPQVLIVLLQGAVLGGGFGLACVSDIAIADHQAQFGMPETSLGLLPAQIAPFVVKRIGLTQARRLALTAARFDGHEAKRLGLVHFVENSPQALAERLDEVLAHVLCCAPEANAATKALLLASDEEPLAPCSIARRNSSPPPSPVPKASRGPWRSCRNANRRGRLNPIASRHPRLQESDPCPPSAKS